jgi:hypothetical protein
MMNSQNKSYRNPSPSPNPSPKPNDFINTTSFLKTIETTGINVNPNEYAEFGQKDVDEIITRYLILKKKINVLLN